MICYVCDQSGRREEALAICIVCGVGLCREHVVREELPVWETLHTGLGEQRRGLPLRLPRFVCAECHQALRQHSGQ
jgi:hypothetical protein